MKQHSRIYTYSPAIAMAFAIAQPATIAITQTPPIIPCSATAYTNDPDPKGTNVRNAPNGKATTLARLIDGDTEIEITGSSGEWLRIKQAVTPDGVTPFKGVGWVYAPLFAVRARGKATLHATDNPKSAALGTMPDEDEAALLGCRGTWLYVKHKAISGWLDESSRCGNPVTTCV